MKIDKLLEFDKKHIWHPYTSATNPIPSYLVKNAKGVYIKLQNGKRLIDGMSSWWAVIHGYNNLVLNKAVKKQLKKMSHVMFGGISHKPAIDLAEKLIKISPKNLKRVFFSDSGSVAVEIAMKMALQYWYAKQKTDKAKFVTIRKGYHGDTWHAMSVCDPDTGMHHIFQKQLPKQFFVDAPKCGFYDKWNDRDLIPIRKLFEQKHNEIAAFILEPIVQGTGGMRFYHPNFLKEISNLCKQYDILLILDEIATGFGRSGKLFACNHSNVMPDIMCLGKAITGGYMSFAATLCSNKIAKTISKSSPSVFMHGPTFMANPLACAVANSSIDLLLSYNWKKKVKKIEKQLKKELFELKSNKNIQDIRVLGAIGVIEMKEEVNMVEIQKEFVSKGVWIRPFGKLIYIMPPYIISKKQLTKLTGVMKQVVSK